MYDLQKFIFNVLNENKIIDDEKTMFSILLHALEQYINATYDIKDRKKLSEDILNLIHTVIISNVKKCNK